MADGESISKLVIDVEVNDKKALLALNALQQRIKNFNSSNGGKAISDMASNMEKMTRNTAQARREAGQFIEQLKKNNKNLMPKDIYSKSIQQWQKELTTAQDKMKNIMSKSNPMKSLTGLEDYTNKAIKARNAIEALQKAQQQASSNSLANFTRIEPDNGKPLGNGEFEKIRQQQNVGAGSKYFSKNIGNEIASFQKETKEAENLESKLQSIAIKVKQLSAYAPSKASVGKQLSKDYLDLEKNIDKAAQRLQSLYTKQALMKNAKPGTERYQKLQIDIKNARSELDGLVSKMRELQSSGKDITSSKKGFDFSKDFSGANKQASRLANTISKEFNKLPQRLMKPLTRLATMFRAMLLRRFIMQVFNSMKEAVDQLAQYSNTIGSDFNKSVSSIVDNFKYLGRVIVTAFEPLINFAAPIIDFLIQKIVDAINAINQFVNAIFGNSTWTKASYNASNYADSLDKASGSAKKLKAQLQGFDELNNLSSNQGGGGSGGGSGAANVGDLFSTQQISESAKGMAERFKEAWAKADFTDIGRDIADKITNTLNGIPWNGIKTTANKIAKSIATFLNGFINPDLFGAVGSTLAESLNTVFGAIGTFANVFDWSNLGKSIASTINKFFTTFDFKQAGMTLTSVASGILTAVTDAVQNIKWETAGSKIVEFISNIDWIKLLAQSTVLLYGIGNAVFQLFSGAVAQIAQNLSELFADLGLDSVSGFFKGMADNLMQTASWIREKFQIVIDAVKNFFDIHSPSKKFEEIGKLLIDGLKQGISNAISSIGAWIKTNVTDKITSAFDTIKNFTSNINFNIPNIKALIEEKWNAFKDWWKDKKADLPISFTDFKAKIKEKWDSFKDWWNDKVKVNLPVSFTDFKSNVSSKWNDLKNWWKDKVKLSLPISITDIVKNVKSAIDKVKKTLKNTIASLKVKLPHFSISVVKTPGKTITDKAWNGTLGGKPKISVSYYQSGGFLQKGVKSASLFAMGENGVPEMLGTVGGKNAVAGGKEITGISDAIYSTSSTQVAMQQKQIDLLTQIVAKEFGISERDIFNSVRNSANDYARRNGIPAF